MYKTKQEKWYLARAQTVNNFIRLFPQESLELIHPTEEQDKAFVESLSKQRKFMTKKQSWKLSWIVISLMSVEDFIRCLRETIKD